MWVHCQPFARARRAYYGYRQTDHGSLLHRQNYSLLHTETDGNQAMIQLEKIGIHGNLDDCDYLLVLGGAFDNAGRL